MKKKKKKKHVQKKTTKQTGWLTQVLTYVSLFTAIALIAIFSWRSSDLISSKHSATYLDWNRQQYVTTFFFSNNQKSNHNVWIFNLFLHKNIILHHAEVLLMSTHNINFYVWKNNDLDTCIIWLYETLQYKQSNPSSKIPTAYKECTCIKANTT